MRTLGTIALVLVLTATASGLRFTGNHHFDARALGELAARAANAEELLRAIAANYTEAGFFEAEVELSGTEDSVVVIDEGKRYRLSDAIISGIDSTYLRMDGFSKNGPLSAALIERIGLGAVAAYADSGYPFASLQLVEIAIAQGRAQLRFSAIAGPRLPIGKISFPGTVASRPNTLLRRVQLKPGAPYRESAIEASTQALRRLDFVASASEPQVAHDLHGNRADIAFPVQERRNFALEGVLTLDPENKPAGQANLEILNVLGYGERVGWRWSRRNAASRELTLSAGLPYVGGTEFDVGIAAAQVDRDSNFVGTRAALLIDYHLGLDWLLGGRLSWHKITPDEGRAAPSARIVEAALTTAFDGRDPAAVRASAVRVSTEFATAYRKSFAEGDGVRTGYSTRLVIDGSGWLAVGGGFMLYQHGLLFQVKSDFTPIPLEQFLEIGGVATLRGYREKAFLAREGAVGATELQYHAGDEAILRVFCDNGWLRTASDELRLTGFGAGTSLRTSLGWFRIDFTLGESKQFDKLMVHFGFDTAL